MMMNMVIDLARHGLIHGDFNEFNLIFNDANRTFTLIDFPQMVSTKNKEAKEFFDRDVNCIKTFFWKRFGIGSDELPELDDVEQIEELDKIVKASGYDFKKDERGSARHLQPFENGGAACGGLCGSDRRGRRSSACSGNVS